MRLNKIVEQIMIIALLVATILSGYVFIVTIIFKQSTYAGVFSSWQFPMLIAIFIDAAFYKHISRLKIA
jgi:hypothetical protein